MNFFKKSFNINQIERIEWFAELDFTGFTRDNISGCKIQFVSGRTQEFQRQLAKELFDYLESSQAQPEGE